MSQGGQQPLPVIPTSGLSDLTSHQLNPAAMDDAAVPRVKRAIEVVGKLACIQDSAGRLSLTVPSHWPREPRHIPVPHVAASPDAPYWPSRMHVSLPDWDGAMQCSPPVCSICTTSSPPSPPRSSQQTGALAETPVAHLPPPGPGFSISPPQRLHDRLLNTPSKTSVQAVKELVVPAILIQYYRICSNPLFPPRPSWPILP